MGVHFGKVPAAFPQLRKKSSERGEKGEGGRGREGRRKRGREGERERTRKLYFTRIVVEV